MKLMKYESPMAPIDRLFDRLNWGFPLERSFGDVENSEEGWALIRLPRTNIAEADDAFVFTMEMPGMDKQDVSVNIEGDTLIVRAEKSEQQEEKGLIRREYRSTKFERSFNVNGINRESVKAKMENGILTVTLPKAADKVGKKIDIA
jgi:HSP20 family protein